MAMQVIDFRHDASSFHLDSAPGRSRSEGETAWDAVKASQGKSCLVKPSQAILKNKKMMEICAKA
jgi:hypothetical protein